jgi:hypothetical protein
MFVESAASTFSCGGGSPSEMTKLSYQQIMQSEGTPCMLDE